MDFEVAFYWALILFSIYSIGWFLTVGLSASLTAYIESKEGDNEKR